MPAAKKFGTFGGVFTPSILTILGVIMYLRLPWLVGQGGLWTTLVIIIVAHVVSVTTGLSVASIATDKKVKTGGAYYIISRSLGLPIGGMLGIALFVGMSIGISLYIVGFSESFLNYWGMDASINSIRIAGTIALVLLTIITLISTSLAIKTQYFIMAAIGLSLLSIFLGKGNFIPAVPVFSPAEDAPSAITLFGIFFPAVTGFTTGVAMSGDLKDPKKAIPFGTMAAIVVGFIVYMGMAVYFAYFIDADSLINNPSILFEASLFAPFVVAGIWGATLSSALGSILGAPRTLQAISMDRITPRIFGKGFGPSNEPRNALLLSFVIAEAGVLIGELNVIARIISMFFITTYGFLNLSSAIEIWASADFRPSFKIPKLIGIIGALSCFFIMFYLDILGLIGGTVVLGGIFLYLKRKELTLESGDTWEGVWSNIVRSGLSRLIQSTVHQRNWRPNIILFSGGGSARPHLLEFGTWLVYKRGILSNFDLIENREAGVLFTKTKQILPAGDGDNFPGIFSRRFECRDVYEGMETITRVYGFSGIDPNAVMLGWARNSQKPAQFARLVHLMKEVDYNVLLLDYDKERGFGNKERIDIWWRGGSNNATLALTMLKFLQSSEEWQGAKARIIIVIQESALANKVYKNMNRVLEDQRLEAELKVINNAIEKRPFHEIIKVESLEADLVMIGMPPVSEKTVERFVANTNSIVDELGTTLLLQASSFFEPIYIGIERDTAPVADSLPPGEKEEERREIDLPSQEALAKPLAGVYERLQQAVEEYCRGYLQNFAAINSELVEELQALIERNFETLEKSLPESAAPRYRKLLTRAQGDYLFHARRLLEEFQQSHIDSQKEELVQGIETFFAQLDAILAEIPPEITIFFELEDTEIRAEDSFYLKNLKRRKRIRHRFFKKPVSLNLRVKPLAQYHFSTGFPRALYEQLESLGIESYRFMSDLQKCLNKVRDSFGVIENRLEQDQLSPELIEEEKIKLSGSLEELSEDSRQEFGNYRTVLLDEGRRMMQSLCDAAAGLDANHRIKRQSKIPKSALQLKGQVSEIPALWAGNQSHILTFTLMDLALMIFQNRLKTIFQKLKREIQLSIENSVLDNLAELESELRSAAETIEQDGKVNIRQKFTRQDGFDDQAVLKELTADLRIAADQLPETVEVITEESFQQIEMQQYTQPEILSVSLRRLVHYLIETDLVTPLQKELSGLSPRLQKSVSVAREVVRLVSFSGGIYSAEVSGEDILEEEGGVEGPQQLASVCSNGIQRLEQERQQVEEISEDLDEFIEKQLQAAFEKLNPYLVIRSSGQLGQYIRTRESRKVLTGVEEKGRQVKTYLENVLVRLWYRKSEGLMLARNFGKLEPEPQTRLDRLLNFSEKISPSPAMLSSLPFYYRQLFLGRQTIRKEFWVGRPQLIRQAERAVNRYRQGIEGGLLILGEPASGKSALCHTIAQRFFGAQKVHPLFAPEGGSIDPARFKSRLEETLRLTGEYEDIFAAIPPDSAIIINDLEMWWERSADGFALIDQVLGLISAYGQRCFFIVNANKHSFRFINRIKKLEDVFLGVIECKPFDARQLQEAILLRHHSTGLKFELNEQPEEEISQFKLARLFTKHFDSSGGYIGTALQAWISHIDKVSGNRLIIRSPAHPDLQPLAQLENEWRVWLLQFILHKQLTPERLMRIFRSDEESIRQKINVIKRSGLITEDQQGVLKISPYLQPFITRKFKELEVL